MSESYPRQFEFQAEVLQRLTRIETNQQNDRENRDAIFGQLSATIKELSGRVSLLEQKRVRRPRWFHITLGTGVVTGLGYALKVIVDILHH